MNRSAHDSKRDVSVYRPFLFSFLVLWALFAVSIIFPPLLLLGIHPRDPDFLIGILLAPLFHGSWEHLLSNSSALLLFGFLFVTLKKRKAFFLFFFFAVVSGALTWIFGRSGAVHIGASGIIYALFGYLLTIGVFQRSFKNIVVSLFIALYYGTVVYGVFPQLNAYISWESHLFGFVAGVVSAWLFK